MSMDEALKEQRAGEYAKAVNDMVRQIPIGRAMTYGLIAEILQDELGYGGPRVVGNVLAGAGSRYSALGLGLGEGAVVGPAQDNFNLPWWRVVNAAGSPPPQYLTAALDALSREGTPMKRDGLKVDLKQAVWYPGIDDAVSDGQ